MSDHRTDAALIALRQILRVTEVSSRAHAKASGLSASQHVVLQVLAAKNGLTQSDLAREVSLGQATVTSLLDRLESWDMITKKRDGFDRRRVVVEITAKGRRTIETAPSLLQERFVQRFAGLADWEQAFLVAGLERTASLLGARDIEAAPFLEVGADERSGEEP